MSWSTGQEERQTPNCCGSSSNDPNTSVSVYKEQCESQGKETQPPEEGIEGELVLRKSRDVFSSRDWG
ncbi:hypothetical protein SKAU_G00360080 [Synaphobranchus kaupii]|uniref:Uncharacterized protein n=1 Tax=Synaphobranchus kaupii TaxID=118154 RepID=A0A9Q1EI49_SYNKA|nr:hypothetical protein SKAU_G00360080 [Synaphobranchus kaupii]